MKKNLPVILASIVVIVLVVGLIAGGVVARRQRSTGAVTPARSGISQSIIGPLEMIWSSLIGFNTGQPLTTSQEFVVGQRAGFYFEVEQVDPKMIAVDIMLDTKGESLSAVAARVEFDHQGSSPIRFYDIDNVKQGVQGEIDETLNSQGFSYPINQAENTGVSTFFDVSAVHISTQTFQSNQPVRIAKISFDPVDLQTPVTLRFNEELTKAVSKLGSEINTGYSSSSYGGN